MQLTHRLLSSILAQCLRLMFAVSKPALLNANQCSLTINWNGLSHIFVVVDLKVKVWVRGQSSREADGILVFRQFWPFHQIFRQLSL